MTLADYQADLAACVRCSSCKWIPFNQMQSARFAKNCPAISRFNFHAYSGSGRMNMALSLLSGRSDLTETVTEVIYRCQMCGACDIHCKVYREVIEVAEALLEMRAHCVEQGQLVVEHMAMIDSLKRENNALGEPRAERGAWAEDLGLADANTGTAEVLLHAGCRFSYDPDLRDAIRSVAALLREVGVDVAIAGTEESCCGGRAYELGYQGEARNFADDVQARVKAAGARILVTACADCFATFNYLYPRMAVDLAIPVLHTSQLLEEFARKGRLRLRREQPLRVTYHDPCHLGRLGEAYLGDWPGDKRQRPAALRRTGKRGVYDAPRKLLAAIPGLELLEMERIRQYAWCCGAGGGVLEAHPEFAAWTAGERLAEARSSGAEALVTACPWCERSFRDAPAEADRRFTELMIYDLHELLAAAAGVTEGVTSSAIG